MYINVHKGEIEGLGLVSEYLVLLRVHVWVQDAVNVINLPLYRRPTTLISAVPQTYQCLAFNPFANEKSILF